MTLGPMLLAGLALLAACSADFAGVAEKYTTPTERRFAREYLQLLADSRVDSAYILLEQHLASDTARRALVQVGQLLRGARLDSMHVIGINANNVTAGSRSWRDLNLTFEMPTSSAAWLVANVATRTSDGQVQVIGFSATPASQPLEVLNRFTLQGKTIRHYLALFFMLLAPIPEVALCIAVARARGMPRRWLWALAALIGSPVFMLNWTTGQFAVQGTLFQLLGVAATKAGPAAPWILSFAAPLGAMVAYLRLRAWLGRSSGSEPVAA
jgi:hypothetical protein